MTTKSSNNISSLKRKVQVVQQTPPPTSPKQLKKESTSDKLKVHIFIEYNIKKIIYS
jgi:hypothetical protein